MEFGPYTVCHPERCYSTDNERYRHLANAQQEAELLHCATGECDCNAMVWALNDQERSRKQFDTLGSYTCIPVYIISMILLSCSFSSSRSSLAVDSPHTVSSLSCQQTCFPYCHLPRTSIWVSETKEENIYNNKNKNNISDSNNGKKLNWHKITTWHSCLMSYTRKSNLMTISLVGKVGDLRSGGFRGAKGAMPPQTPEVALCPDEL